MPVRTSKEIVFDIFLDCKKLCLGDKYWENICDGFAKGKPPRGIYISPDGMITKYSKKKKGVSFTYSINGRKPEDILKDLQELFVKYTDIFPKGSIKQKEADIISKINDKQPIFENWKSIKKKNIREKILLKYARKIMSKYKLSPSAAISFFKDLKIRFMIFNESSDVIKFNNGDITFIEGYVCRTNSSGISEMVWEVDSSPKKQKFDPPSKSSSKSSSVKAPSQILLSYFWTNLLKKAGKKSQETEEE